VRLFVAADLPADLRERLAAAQSALRTLPFEVRWVRPEGIHLTFFFIGEVVESRVGAIEEALRAALREAPGPFRLKARGVGAFPEHGRPRVIWAGIEGDLESGARVKMAIDRALAGVGFATEEREFRPHLTLGRVKEGRGGNFGGAMPGRPREDFGEFEVRAIVLFQSHLGAGGARYSALAGFPLVAGDGDAR
jgi:2'-5' RNA ligase